HGDGARVGGSRPRDPHDDEAHARRQGQDAQRRGLVVERRGPGRGGAALVRALARRMFLEDTLLKAVALVLALVLFFAVRGDKDAATASYATVIYSLPQDRVL